MKTCKGCKHYKKDERIGIIVCEFGLHESYCEKDKEDFAVDVLEKIKEEMKGDRDSVDISCRDSFNWNIGIIDKHIAELKGEQE